jgi:hypothetical protein
MVVMASIGMTSWWWSSEKVSKRGRAAGVVMVTEALASSNGTVGSLPRRMLCTRSHHATTTAAIRSGGQRDVGCAHQVGGRRHHVRRRRYCMCSAVAIVTLGPSRLCRCRCGGNCELVSFVHSSGDRLAQSSSAQSTLSDCDEAALRTRSSGDRLALSSSAQSTLPMACSGEKKMMQCPMWISWPTLLIQDCSIK